MDIASTSGAAARDSDDDDDEYEEADGGSRMLGFMFGNVGCSGDLDVDYLDEDAKEHLAALADKLGPSLKDIDLSKSSPTPTDASEQDYDEKAEDAIDYEDIDEQYDGPEIQATTEVDHLMSKKDYFSSVAFDEENYDEEEEAMKEDEVIQEKFTPETVSSEGIQINSVKLKAISPDESFASAGGTSAEDTVYELEDSQGPPDIVQDHIDSKSDTSLPVLCIENGLEILKFSEIFGVHEPLKKAERKDHQRSFNIDEWVKTVSLADLVEEDEEDYLRSSFNDLFVSKHQRSFLHDVETCVEQNVSGVKEPMNDSCICAQPMKDDMALDSFSGPKSPSCPEFYPFDQQDWEDDIIWGSSPETSHGGSESRVISEVETESHSVVVLENGFGQRKLEPDRTDLSLHKNSVSVEPFGSRKLSSSPWHQMPERSYHPQLLRLDSVSKQDIPCPSDMELKTTKTAEVKSDVLCRFSKLASQNKDLLEGSWLDHIIWDSDEAIPKPKIILDLQDEQMLFEILDPKAGEQLSRHAGARIITRSSKGDFLDLHDQGIAVDEFNISNDNYYSSRKTSQQAKPNAKKRASLGVKVMHSVPALKLQTMKPKLSNKDIANFHRPKALWYPHENKVVAKLQGPLCASGLMKIILMTLGGKGIKLLAHADESLSSVKIRASKKLDFKPSEEVKVLYSNKELDDDISLSIQNVRPNSVLHLIRTRIHVWPKAQKLPGDNKPLRPPGAFKKISELSLRDGHVFLMEYCEERPLLLGNVGMGARLCTYYQKMAPGDQTALSLRNSNNGLGNVITLEPNDKSPFLGDINPGSSQSSLETNMFRAPVFPHKLATTDYLLVRSAKGVLSIRRVDKLYAVGQQEPHMEVLSPSVKNIQSYTTSRMMAYINREFRAKEKPGVLPIIRVDELASYFPSLTDASIRKRLKQCADMKSLRNGQFCWVRRRDYHIPSEEEIRRSLTPEDVCSYESMVSGLHRLKHLGINRLTHPVDLSSAMNQLPDEAIALAAASHIERELQITSWNLSSNFVACTNQNRENIERLEITGVGDPSGHGLGFSYVRVASKAPVSNTAVKKKVGTSGGSLAVTGTDADLRRLSMEAAREVLLKFNVPEEQIDKLTRWHRIAMVRKLSSEQASSGVKVDATPLSKFARGQRMSFLQLQQQTREKCQEIWDRQLQSLSSADGDEYSDSEANSDLDSFAGDLENLLDAEECEEEEVASRDLKRDKTDSGVKGLKMRRCPSEAQTEEGIEDDEAEAALVCRLLEDDEDEGKKKKPIGIHINHGSLLGPNNADYVQKSNLYPSNTPHLDGYFKSQKLKNYELQEVNVTTKKGNGKNETFPVGVVKKIAPGFKEKKYDKPIREGIICGACGQVGHMRTNKNCPKYGEDVFGEKKVEDAETSELGYLAGKPHRPDIPNMSKKSTPKSTAKVADWEVSENVSKGPSVKFICGPSDKSTEKGLRNTVYTEPEARTAEKISKIRISRKTVPEGAQHEPQGSFVLPRSTEADREQPYKKLIIKQPKVRVNVEPVNYDIDIDIEMDHECRKMKKIAELSTFERHRKQEGEWPAEGKRRPREQKNKRIDSEWLAEERTMRTSVERRTLDERRGFLGNRRYDEPVRKEEVRKGKKKKKPDFQEDYITENRSYRTERRISERAAKRRPVVDLDQDEYAPMVKRRRGGEVLLSNIFEDIVDNLIKDNAEVSFLFVKPVSKKEAPDYYHIIERPMDLSTIREKARKLEYKCRDDFRHDLWQITFNAHTYNDGRNPGIPPLADQLLEIGDYLLEMNDKSLTNAEADV